MTPWALGFERGSRWCGRSIVVGWISITGCSGSGFFQCDNAEQCALDGQPGTCEADGYCSFPDESCDSDRRYGELAPPELAGTCVPVAMGTAGSSTTGGSTPPPATPPGDGTSSSGAPPLEGDGTSSSSGDPPEGSSSGVMPPVTTGPATGSETGPPVMTLSYPAVVTGCNDPMDLDPMACEVEANPTPGAIMVDLEDEGLGPFRSFMRFDLDGALVPEAVVSVTLRVGVTTIMGSDSISTGEVYEVEPFTYGDLYMFQPGPVGMMLAPDQGAAMLGATIDWPLPPDLLSDPGPSLYLGIFPVDTDGVDYWSIDGKQPPELIVEQER